MANKCDVEKCNNNALWKLNYPGITELLCTKHLSEQLGKHSDFDYHITHIDKNSPFNESITVTRISPTHFSIALGSGETVSAAIVIGAAEAIRIISVLQRGICEMIRLPIQEMPRSGVSTYIIGKPEGGAYFEPDL